MQTFDKLYNLFSYVKKLSLFISSLGIIAMILIISADVFLRNVFSIGIPGSYEIVESMFMPIAIFWALIVAYASGSIPRIDMLMTKFTGSWQLLIGICLILIDLFIFIAMTYYGWHRAEIALTTGAAISVGGKLVSIAPLYVLIPIAFLLLTIESIFIFIKMLVEKKYQYSIDKENQPMQE